ncbi:MAG: porin [Phenylobacterium sp.]|nr:porin [Phenylobacterium sp.]
MWTLGVNWFPNPAVKFMLDYYDVSVERKNAAGAAIGQDYRAVNLRSQIAF